jgi:hypothetical protein
MILVVRLRQVRIGIWAAIGMSPPISDLPAFYRYRPVVTVPGSVCRTNQHRLNEAQLSIAAL